MESIYQNACVEVLLVNVPNSKEKMGLVHLLAGFSSGHEGVCLPNNLFQPISFACI